MENFSSIVFKIIGTSTKIVIPEIIIKIIVKNSKILTILRKIYGGGKATRYALFKMVRQPSTDDEAVQITPIMARVIYPSLGPEIISLILGAKPFDISEGIDEINCDKNSVPIFDSPKSPITAIMKINDGKKDKMLKKAKYPACSIPS